jgi:hypothetical protein
MTGIAKLQPLDPVFSRGPRASFGETVSASFQREQEVGELTDEVDLDREIYAPFEAFFNSTVRPMDETLSRHGMVGSGPVSQETFDALTDQGWHPDDATLTKFLGEMDAAGISYPDDIRPDAIGKRRAELEAAKVKRVKVLDETLSRSSGASGLGAQFAGGIGASLDNIETIATLPIGATARMGILATALTEGAVAGATEVVSTPERNEFLQRLNLPEESLIQNVAQSFAVGATLGGTIRTAREYAPQAAAAVGRSITNRATRKAMADLGRASEDAEARAAGNAVARDLEDEEAAVTNPDADTVREHEARAQQAAMAARGEDLDMPDRPVIASPRQSIINGEIEEVDPQNMLVQPEVFQFKSDIVAPGGVTPKLAKVGSWSPERAGIVLVYEYADGRRAIADGHQRTALANRIMAQDPSQKITLAAKVFKEADDFTVEDMRVLAAFKNIAESADGMTSKMSMDAAKVLRIKPDAISNLPAGPGIARARELSALSDDAFSMAINKAIPEDQAALVGRLVADQGMQAPIMRLLQKVDPDTQAQAESIIQQALAAPRVETETFDLFGGRVETESLYLERAKVLERAMRMMKDDRSIFRTLTDRADTIEGSGANRLDAATNREVREATERAMVAVQALAYRAGPISEALNNGAKAYKTSGKLADAASAVVSAVRDEVRRNGLAGGGTGRAGRAAKPARSGAEAPDPNDQFSDPVSSPGVDAQIEQTRIDPTPQEDSLFDAVPVGSTLDEDGNPVAVTMSRQQLADELDADDAMVGFAEACLRK